MPRKAKKSEVSAGESVLRTPPQDLNAERGLLGYILLDSTRVMDLCLSMRMTPEVFYDPAHQVIFRAMSEMVNSLKAIDAITLAQHLQAGGDLERVGGIPFLEEVMRATPTAAHAQYYRDIVYQKFLLRQILLAASETQERCYAGAESVDVILGWAEQRFLDLNGTSSGRDCSWKSSIELTVSQIEQQLRNPDGGLTGLPSGLANLDRMIHGLRKQEMIVLAARPSQGKTSLAMNIAECVALGRRIDNEPFPGAYAGLHPVGVFSCEMNQQSLAKRMLAGVSGIPMNSLGGRAIDPQEIIRRLTTGASIIGRAPIFVDDASDLDVMDLRARARRMKKQHHIELLVIDYLQLLSHREYAKQGRQIEVSKVSSNIKAMAKELDIPVLVLSQLSRNTEQHGDKNAIPKLSDLRDSGAIEQDADVVLMLRRPCKYPGSDGYEDKDLAIVDVAKQRNGQTGEVRLNFNGEFTRFSDRHDPVAG